MSKLLALAERAVPRYTSYPTAPHFSAEIGPADYAAWLAGLPSDATLSLYLHVPYCIELCLYCGCHTKAAQRRDPIERYADRLLQEIDRIADITGPRRVVHLHWGGGTPSILGDARLVEIAERIGARFNLSAQTEHAIEIDPRRMSADLARTLARIGVNRISLGVQDFAPHVQQAIGRIQTFAQVEQAVQWLRDAGIARINIDLMYGLPRQTVQDVARSAALAASLGPQRLALFGYAHVPWFKSQQRLIDEAELPGASERLTQAETAAATLSAHGFVPVGLDHFAKPEDDLATANGAGALHRNFQGYTTDAADALIGLGASAIGRLPQGFVQNAVDTAAYSRAVDAGQLATVKGLRLTDDDRLRAKVIERLMCDLAVDLDAVATAMGSAERFEAELEALQPTMQEGVVALEGRRLVVSARGRAYVRLVAASFDAYLADKGRHSIAV